MRAWNCGVDVREYTTELMRLLDALYVTEEEKRAWLQTPQPLLDGAVPMDLVVTPEGYAKCVNVLRCIADGAYL